MTAIVTAPKARAAEDGLTSQSGPGRDLVFKLTGEDTRGAVPYFLCEVAPHGRPAGSPAPPPGRNDPRPQRSIQSQGR